MRIQLILMSYVAAAYVSGLSARAAEPTTAPSESQTPHWTALSELQIQETPRSHWSRADRVPAMIGDFYGGPINLASGRLQLDRLFAIADDLDSPAILPPATSTLSITEAGPVGVFSSSITTVQQLQQILHMGGTPPAATLAGQVADVATLTTQSTIADIQTLLASTPEAFDVISLAAPPGSYLTTVDGLFQGRNATTGTTVFESTESGALLQNGGDALTGGEDFDAFYFFSYGVDMNLPIPGVGSGVTGVEKLAQGSTVIPRDRVFFHYGLFDNVRSLPGDGQLHRFTPGFESTFADRMMSIEVRAPFASTIDSDFTFNELSGTDEVRFGNVQLYLKMLLASNDEIAISTGTGISIPTEKDLTVRLPDGTPFLEVENQSVHLQPFIAAAISPDSPFFLQGILQFDFDANGNPVSIQQNGSGLLKAGTLQASEMLYIDLNCGYWLMQEPAGSPTTLTGLATIFEVHHNQSLTDTDSVSSGQLRIGSDQNSISSTSLVAGLVAELAGNSNLSVGYVIPVSGSGQRQIDGALQVALDWRLP